MRTYSSRAGLVIGLLLLCVGISILPLNVVSSASVGLNTGNGMPSMLPFTITRLGVHTATYSFMDTFRNRAETASDNGRSDSTPPTTTHTFSGTMGNNNWYITNVTVTLTSTDTDSGVNHTYYKQDNDGWNTYTTPITVTTNGAHNIRYYATDNAGNTEPIKGPYLFQIDTAKPITNHTLTGTMGNNTWYTTNVTITLSTVDPGSGVNHTYYQIDEDDWNTYTTSFIVSEEGTHTLKYYSVDIAGNTEPVKGPYPFQIDATKPVTTHAFSGTMGNNNWYTSSVTITLTATDPTPPKTTSPLPTPRSGTGPSGINHTYYKIDNGTWAIYTSSVSVSADGSHTISYYSVDIAGNTEPVKGPFSFKIDRTTPDITLTATRTGLKKWQLLANVSDATSGVNKVDFYVDSVLQGTVYAPGPYLWNYTGTGKTAYAIGFDNAGNSKTSPSVGGHIDPQNQPLSQELSLYRYATVQQEK